MSDAIFEIKKQKYRELLQQGELLDQFLKKHDCATAAAKEIGDCGLSTAGRVVGLRTMGKILFAHLYDFSGKIQICVRKNDDKPGFFEKFIEDVSVGDFIGVTGELFLTKTGERTIRVDSWKMLNKCLRTLPEKYHGIEDIESRYRQRYLDLIMNEESRNVFKKRIEITKSLRRFLEDSGFLEVETPVIQTQVSGALARPFHTHHNALDIDCTLRIAPETYLKRCIGAGMDRVFEFARCFRNEGISATHLQDFTMLEFYASYWNADGMMIFVKQLMAHVIQGAFGTEKTSLHGHDIDFNGDWPVYDYAELIKKDSGIDIRIENNAQKLAAALTQHSIKLDDADAKSWTNMADLLYKKVTRPKLIQPCFLTRYPVGMCPLARRNKNDENYVDMFQFVVAGVELVKGYSELVDPLDQRARFEEQVAAREAGDAEALPMDEDYLTAMEHGFPPIAGVGIGIDRLAMVLSGCENIKDTVLFPLLRPQI